MNESRFNNRKLSRIFLCVGVHSHSFSLEVVVVLGAHVTFNTVWQFSLTFPTMDERLLHFLGRLDAVYNQEAASLQHDLAVFLHRKPSEQVPFSEAFWSLELSVACSIILKSSYSRFPLLKAYIQQYVILVLFFRAKTEGNLNRSFWLMYAQAMVNK